MRSLLTAIVLISALALQSHAQVTLYDTTTGAQHENSFGPAPMLDDVFVTPGPALTITKMEFGYRNTDSSAQNVDAVVRSWDHMNVAAGSGVNVNSGLIASFTHPIGSVAGEATGTTGLFNLTTPINLPDNNFGVQINFVFAGTSTLADVDALLSTSLPTVGSTNDMYWSDDTFTIGSFTGDDRVSPNPGNPGVHENLYLRLDGTIPEPSSALLMCAAAGMMLRRTRGRPGARG